MGSDFLEHLKQVAREPDPQPIEPPPVDCPRCAALALMEYLIHQMECEHTRTDT